MMAAKPKDHKDNKEKPEDERPWEKDDPQSQQPKDQPSKPEQAKPEQKDDPSDQPLDTLTAVDFAGTVIQPGMFCDVYYCKIVGLRPDENNRFNVWVIPALNSIKTIDPTNPLTGQIDNKAILVSGYNIVVYPSTKTPDDLQAPPANAVTAIKDIITKVKDGTAESDLPSNFLAPSII